MLVICSLRTNSQHSALQHTRSIKSPCHLLCTHSFVITVYLNSGQYELSDRFNYILEVKNSIAIELQGDTVIITSYFFNLNRTNSDQNFVNSFLYN